MNRLLRVISLVAISVLLSSAVALAQLSTAQLSGRVADESGAVLPGVTVTVTQTDTGLTRSVVTDENGAYVLPNLPTGPYRLEAMLQGFRTYSQTGIVLQVAATPVLNVVLGIGNLAETVSVEAAAPLVDVQSAGISDVVDNERIGVAAARPAGDGSDRAGRRGGADGRGRQPKLPRRRNDLCRRRPSHRRRYCSTARGTTARRAT